MPGMVAASQTLGPRNMQPGPALPWQGRAQELPQQAFHGDNPWESQQPLAPAMSAWASEADIQQARVNASQRVALSGSVWREFRSYPAPSAAGPVYVRGVQDETAWYKGPAVAAVAVLAALGAGFWLASR